MRHYPGLIDVTDIYPTLCEAAGVTIPNPDAMDGISFWPQVLGAPGEPRKVIYTWYNANHKVPDVSRLVRYAFNTDFKRYAPHQGFPNGRFFDLRTDPLELAGDREVHVKWAHYHRSGLELDELAVAQRAAYDELGKVLEANRHVPVASLDIRGATPALRVGESTELRCMVMPAGATRRNVIWESSDPSVATIDKFGTLTAHTPGETRIRVYSWDDAMPLANGSRPAYRTNGIQDRIDIRVQP
jgi:hypothetical protein